MYVRIERNLVQPNTMPKHKMTYTCVLDKLEHGTSNSYTPKDHVGTYSALAGSTNETKHIRKYRFPFPRWYTSFLPDRAWLLVAILVHPSRFHMCQRAKRAGRSRRCKMVNIPGNNAASQLPCLDLVVSYPSSLCETGHTVNEESHLYLYV